MTLLELYKEKNNNPDWFNKHFSLAKDAKGRFFEYSNTNFRTQVSFISQFKTFLEVENLPRNDWPKNSNGQEVHKQHVVNMLQSKLFKINNDSTYSKTSKGLEYENFLGKEFNDGEKWLINYLFLLNGYYTNRKNYIIYRTKEDLLECLLSVDGLTVDLLINFGTQLLKLQGQPLGEIMRNPFFFIHSFYSDSDFLTKYLRSSEEEKEELVSYIENNIKNETFDCCISKKYQPSGNSNRNMLLDETAVFLLTLLFIRSNGVDISNVYKVFVDNFNNNIKSISKNTVLSYLFQSKDIFDPIFKEILELEESEILISDKELTKMAQLPQIDKPEEYLDETSESGRQQIKALFAMRKKQARIESGYKCALETINNCSPIYFTAKTNKQNYLELHHFIPQEFRNDFSHSIEVLANYITLCPRCHRQIHLAVDRERQYLINALYEDRKDRLKTVGLGIDLKDAYEYYKIDV